MPQLRLQVVVGGGGLCHDGRQRNATKSWSATAACSAAMVPGKEGQRPGASTKRVLGKRCVLSDQMFAVEVFSLPGGLLGHIMKLALLSCTLGMHLLCIHICIYIY